MSEGAGERGFSHPKVTLRNPINLYHIGWTHFTNGDSSRITIVSPEDTILDQRASGHPLEKLVGVIKKRVHDSVDPPDQA